MLDNKKIKRVGIHYTMNFDDSFGKEVEISDFFYLLVFSKSLLFCIQGNSK